VGQQGRGEADRDAEIGTTKSFYDGKGDSNYSALTIEERTTGTARSSLRVIDDFVGEHITHVALRDEWADELAFCEFLQN
jgi:hypothetical protein